MAKTRHDSVFEDLLDRCLACQQSQQLPPEELLSEIRSGIFDWDQVMRAHEVLGQSSFTDEIWNTFGLQGVVVSLI